MHEHGDAKVKKELHMLLEMAEPGDTIITLEVSRLSRSTQQLCEIIDVIRDKHLRLVIVGSITIDCREGKADPMSEAFLQMAGVFSQLELAMIRARVRSGMENARAKGKKIGRKPTTKDDIPAVFYKHFPAYMTGSMNVSELARICGLSRPTVYKYMRQKEIGVGCPTPESSYEVLTSIQRSSNRFQQTSNRVLTSFLRHLFSVLPSRLGLFAYHPDTFV